MLRNTRLVAVIGVYLCSAFIFTSFSQESPIQYATDIKFQEWQNVIHAPEGRVDRQVKVVDIGDANVAVGVLFRDRIEADEEPVGVLFIHMFQKFIT